MKVINAGTIFLVVVLFTFSHLMAQSPVNDSFKKSGIALEFGGAAGYGSVNYLYRLKTIKWITLSSRVGAGFYTFKDFTNAFNPDMVFPVALEAYFGTVHSLDVSIGQSFASIVMAETSTGNPSRRNSWNTFYTIGYRYQKKSSRIFIKLTYFPIFQDNKYYRHWGGLVIGYNI